jgi:hypothetical protein
MLEGESPLTLELLNTASQAWVEQEYHRKESSEIKETPLDRYLRGPSVSREGPSSDALRRAFRTEVSRIQRRSDGTATVEGVRFEVPAAYRTLLQLRVRVARWDLSAIDLVDPRSALPAGLNAEVRDTLQLGAQRVKGGMATNVSDKVTWTSSDASVVTVDSTAKATTTGIGTATISTTYEGFTAAVNAKVAGRTTSAEVEAASISLAKGTSYKLGTIGIVEDFSKRALPAAQASARAMQASRR